MLLRNVASHMFALMVGFSLVNTSVPVYSKDLQDYISHPGLVGEARLSMYFWDIYDASLVASNGQFKQGEPFAFSLTYLRDFDGKDIASYSVDEMRKLGMVDEMKLAKWYQTMLEIFPDVKEGETITGIVDQGKSSHFFVGDQLLGLVHDEEFSVWFFSIWLSERTSEPEMRMKLLGMQ